MPLRSEIELLAAREAGPYSDKDFALFAQFKASLNRGEIRAAERDADGKWQTNAWVKRGILLGFRMGMIGGVLEPAGAMPVIIEDDVIVGGNCGVYEGAIVRERAVLGSGVIITGSTPVFDLVRETMYRRRGEAPLEIPAGAVVVPGARAVQSEKGREWGLSLYAPVIVKYRDEKTDAATQLEDLLR